MTDEKNTPLIVGFVADLMFATKIENVAQQLGYRVHWVENAAIMGKFDPRVLEETPGELLHGREGQLFEAITNWQPALLIFDLTNKQIPWQQWIGILRSSPATRRIPILCFGPHEDVEIMQRAKKLGATQVVARSRFTSELPSLLQKLVRVPNREALTKACTEPLAETAVKGIELFNQGKFFDAHEELELAWKADKGPGRNLYRAILQIAVAYLQIERGNYRGAVKMFWRVRQWLDPLPDVCRGVNVAALRQHAEAVYEQLMALGEARITELDRSLFQPIQYTQPE
ncbi:MAG: DUF309 domain-containing protein [Chloroflexi bacterium]|nr:MAG: DUF309 domain-containing protein [Chloroflexota bacterium]